MLMDPHPSQQHVGLHHAVWQLQQEVTRLKARRSLGWMGEQIRCQHILVSCFTCTPHGDLVWLLSHQIIAFNCFGVFYYIALPTYTLVQRLLMNSFVFANMYFIHAKTTPGCGGKLEQSTNRRFKIALLLLCSNIFKWCLYLPWTLTILWYKTKLGSMTR